GARRPAEPAVSRESGPAFAEPKVRRRGWVWACAAPGWQEPWPAHRHSQGQGPALLPRLASKRQPVLAPARRPSALAAPAALAAPGQRPLLWPLQSQPAAQEPPAVRSPAAPPRR